MSNKKDVSTPVSTSRRAIALEECMDYALSSALAYTGGVFMGLSIKKGSSDFLLTIRAHFPAGHMIAWVGAETMTDVLLKAVRMCNGGDLKFQPDKYRQE